MLSIQRIISGGQTGADRAVLDWAIENGILHGGWCPKGNKAEDGTIDPRYCLKQTPQRNYLQRTEWNVRDSDGTVIFTIGERLSGGSQITADFATKDLKPWIHLCATVKSEEAAARLDAFIREHEVKVLNVAGSRASKEPTVGDFVRAVLSATSSRASSEANQKALT